MMIRRRAHFTLLIAATALAVSGCATKKYVATEVEAAEARSAQQIGEVATQVEANQTRLEDQQGKLGDLDERTGKISQTAQEALDRAVAAGKLAEGKFLYETLLTDDKVRFGFDSADLGESAATAIDEFAAELTSRNENVYIEIQGHTDSTGSEAYNLQLGEERAEAVRRYLAAQHGLALHRMSVISYGESAPIADNGSREGRAQNRRVVLVVLK